VLATPPGLAGVGDCEKIDYVTCDADGDVTALDLGGVALQGPLPVSFSSLAALQRLYLQDNQLSGVLPEGTFAGAALKCARV